MADVLENLQKLHDIPIDIHWFCPKTSQTDDASLTDDEEQRATQRHGDKRDQEPSKKVAEAMKRKKLAMDCLQILSFDGADAKQPQKQYLDALKTQLTRCDACVRSYHQAIPKFFDELHEEFDDEQVEDFKARIQAMNTDRIKSGLDRAKKDLLRLAPEERSVAKVDAVGIYGLFEALCCTAFLDDQDLMSMHFDKTFQLIQTKKRLKVTAYTPAGTLFLFDQDEARRSWATKTWRGIKRTMLRRDFDWATRDGLERAMGRVQMTNLEQGFLTDFWSGVRDILCRVNKDLITHSLRAMKSDIYRLALEHLNLDFDGFPDLMACFHILLDRSPDDFWDAMGAISATVVVEQIFNSAALDKVFKSACREGDDDLSRVNDAVSWIDPLLESLKPHNQVSACQAILNQLLGRLQGDQYAEEVRNFFYSTGLSALNKTLRSLTAAQPKTQLGEATIADMLEIVVQQMPEVASRIRASRVSTKDGEAARLGLQIIENAVALDCRTLVVDFKQLASNQTLSRSGSNAVVKQSQALWQTINENVTKNDVNMAAKTLLGCRELIGIEPFAAASAKTNPDFRSFNAAFERISKSICVVLEKLGDCSESNLKKLFEDQAYASAVFATLFASDQGIHDAALEVFKAASSATGRKEAVESAMERYTSTTLSMIQNFAQRLAELSIFNPMPRALRFCGDIVDVLCDSQNGLLRSRTFSAQEITNVEGFWTAMWKMLTTIFRFTESWSKAGHDKEMMKTFCRDTMQFADGLFGSYGIFHATIRDATTENGEAVPKISHRLLERPAAAMHDIAKWLRLRDDYLITKSLSLVCMLLGRLKEENVEPPGDVFKFIEGIIRREVKSNLTRSQLAELTRALEAHVDIDFQKAKGNDADNKNVSKNRQGQLNLGQWKAASDVQKASGLSSHSTSASAIPKRPLTLSSRESHSKAVGRALPEVRQNVPAEDIKRIRQRQKEEKEKEKAVQRAKAQAIRAGGSGAQGIGVEGKDHNKKTEGIYVEEDESEDEEDAIDAEMFGISVSKLQKRSDPQQKKEQMPAQPVKKKRATRTQGEMRARLAPNLSKLHSTILSWDFFHEGDYPPGSRSELFRAVTRKFLSPVQYKETFQPLLELEAWQGFVKAREENAFKPYEVKIVNRATVDAFVEVSTTMTQASNKELPVMEGDVVLLSKDKSPATAGDVPHCLARVHGVKRKGAGMLEVLYRAVPNSPGTKALTPQAMLYGLKIQSLTPLEREYGALCSLEYYDLCDEIVQAKPSPLLTYSDSQLQEFIKNYNVNKAQAKAVKSAIDNDAFTLIQGPPGSGKTKTIIAIVGALMSSSLATSHNNVMQKPGMPNIEAQRSAGASHKKLLVCAPSNAAVDELVLRLKQGVKTRSGTVKKVNVVRIGRSDNINAQVRDVTLEELVNARLAALPGEDTDKIREKTQKIMEEHKKVSAKLREVREQLDEGKSGGDEFKKLSEDYHGLKRRKAELGTQVDSARDEQNNVGRQADLNRRREQQKILDESHIICATLSGSGHEMFRTLNVEFETVVVDEAAQCVEMSALIPLKYGCAKCILVGDPKQLPPTVFSKEAARFQYEQSLFVRMQLNHPKDVHLLDTQYRMHPDISHFPSQAFYDSLLLDGPDMASLRQRPWHQTKLLSPYRFFDVKGHHESEPRGHSLVNYAEIEIALCMYAKLTSDYRDYNFKGKIGVISPYKSQMRQLKSRFQEKFGQSVLDNVEFNTTDAYQGREREIIIFSCVRASPAGGVGFLQDIRRMNVGLTRAKSSLWVLGNSTSLSRGEWWKKLLDDAKQRGLWTDGDVAKAIKMSKASKVAPVKPDPAVKMEIDEEDSGGPTTREASRASSVKDESESDAHRNGALKDRRGSSATPSDVEMEDASDVKEEEPEEPKTSKDENGSVSPTKPNGGGEKPLPDKPKTGSGQAPNLIKRPASTIPRKRKPTSVFMPPDRQKRR